MFGYTALVLSLITTAFIGFGVWVHHMFATPLPRLGQGLFTASSLMIVVPNAVQIFCWTATLCTGRLWMKTPLIWMLGFFATFLIGGLTGVTLACVSADHQVHDTFFVVAHLHYVLIGGAVFPLFGAFYYWFPKWTGRMLSEAAGKWHFWLFFLGFHLTFFPMHKLGFDGMPRRVYTYLPETDWQYLNVAVTCGVGLMGLGVLTFLGNVLVSRKTGVIAGDDPWAAPTLEWGTSSPPPSYNFRNPPTVRSLNPLWEDPPDTPVVVGLSVRHREVLVTTTHDALPDHRYHMAGESVWSVVAALIVTGLMIGSIFHPLPIVIGLAVLLLALAGWFWPTKGPEPIHNPGEREDAP
jgi:cytochrome c oxidase subunit 1